MSTTRRLARASVICLLALAPLWLSASSVAAVGADDMILDIGPRTAATLTRMIATAGTIVWNGPVGVFEYDQFAAGTRALAHAIANSGAYSIAGGGDTLAAEALAFIERHRTNSFSSA